MAKRPIKITAAAAATHSNAGTPRAGRGKAGAAQDMFTRALAYHQAGNLEHAEGLYEKILSGQPDHFDSMHLLGVLRHHQKRHQEAFKLIDAALKINAQSESAWTNHGVVLEALGRNEEALEHHSRALALKPDYHKALNNRGHILRLLKRPHEALLDFDKALAVKPDFVEATNNRNAVLLQLGRTEEALAGTDRVLALYPDSAPALANRADALRDLHRLDEALDYYEKARALDPEKVELTWNESLVRLLTGDFERGWERYECRWNWKQFSSPRRNFSQPLWLGDASIEGKRILLHAEQGFGDTLQFCRYAKLVAALGATVLLEVPLALKGLLNGLEGVSRILAKGEPLPKFDFHCPLLSLPFAFKTRLETVPADVPYIRPPLGLVAKWQHKLGEKTLPRVGIVWSGSTTHTGDARRSIPLEKFLRLAPGSCQLVSLQKEVRAHDQPVLAANPGVLHFGDDLTDFSETAALAQCMDLIISVDTSVAHLAGAIGTPVWILLADLPDWRWMMEREDSPWYPSVRLFRQPTKGNWDTVIDKVSNELRAHLPQLAEQQKPNHSEIRESGTVNILSDQLDWDAQAKAAAAFIPAGATVLDLNGCGSSLEAYLPAGSRRLGVDDPLLLEKMDRGEYPDHAASSADIITVFGVAEHLRNPATLLQWLKQTDKPVILTYPPTNLTTHLDREAFGWKNHYSTADLAQLIVSSDFQVHNIEKRSSTQMLFALSPKGKIAEAGVSAAQVERGSPAKLQDAAPSPARQKDRLRILLLNDEFYTTGASTAILRLAERLMTKHEVAVLPRIDGEGEVRKKIEALGIPIVKSAEKVDVIVANTLVAGSFVAQYGPRFPVIWWIHEAEIGRNLILKHPSLASGFAQASAIVFQTEYQKTVYGSFLFDSPADVHVLPFWNDAVYTQGEIVPMPKDRLRIVSIGTIEPRKRYEDIVRAVELLDEKLKSQVECVFIGKYLELGAAEKRIVDAHPGRYRILGELSNLDALRYLASADCFTLVSSSESQPLTIWEAFELQVPVCLSDLDTYRHYGLRHGLNALMHPVGKVEFLAENLRTALTSNAIRSSLSTSAKHLLKETLATDWRDQFESVIERAAAGRK